MSGIRCQGNSLEPKTWNLEPVASCFARCVWDEIKRIKHSVPVTSLTGQDAGIPAPLCPQLEKVGAKAMAQELERFVGKTIKSIRKSAPTTVRDTVWNVSDSNPSEDPDCIEIVFTDGERMYIIALDGHSPAIMRVS